MINSLTGIIILIPKEIRFSKGVSREKKRSRPKRGTQGGEEEPKEKEEHNRSGGVQP